MTLQYIHPGNSESKMWDHRMAMCEYVSKYEGTEIGDIIGCLLTVARMYHAYEDYKCQHLLLLAEAECHEYVENCLKARQVDWEEYDDFNPEVYKHFSGGARKLTKEEYENRTRFNK